MAAIPKFDEPVCEEPAFRLTSIGVEDYLAAEDGAGFRSEYIAGQVFAMTGASATHNIICVNLALALAPHARAGGCQFFLNDMKLRLSLRGIDCFYYPDAMICCDPADNHPLYRERPCLLVEVLSESTARIDRREKYLSYTQIAGLRGYLLLDQDAARAQLHRCDDDGLWQQQSFDDPAAVLDLPCAGAVPLAELYAGLHIG